MLRQLVALAMVVFVSPFVSAAENTAAFGEVAKAMFEEVGQYKTIGDFNERFLPAIEEPTLRRKYEDALRPRASEPFPKFELLKDQRGFRLVHEGVTADFVLVSAKDFKWTVNGVNWKLPSRFGNAESFRSLAAILHPKKGAALRMLVDEARAAGGEAPIEIMKTIPIIGIPIGYMAGMVEHMDECFTRVNFNRWMPMPFGALEYLVGIPACGALSAVWPLALLADRMSDPLGIKNLPDKIGGIPKLTCPQDNPQKELKIEFLTTEGLNDRGTFVSYRWQYNNNPNWRGKPSALVVKNSQGDFTMSYPTLRSNHTMLRTSEGRSIRMAYSAVSTTSITHDRFKEVCDDPVKKRDYQARFVAQERKWNRNYGTAEAQSAHAGRVVPTPTAVPRGGSR